MIPKGDGTASLGLFTHHLFACGLIQARRPRLHPFGARRVRSCPKALHAFGLVVSKPRYLNFIHCSFKIQYSSFKISHCCFQHGLIRLLLAADGIGDAREGCSARVSAPTGSFELAAAGAALQ